MTITIKRGSQITLSGRTGEILFPSLNKVKVRWSNGQEEMISYQQIKLATIIKN